MQYQVEAKVDGEVYVGAPVFIKQNGLTFDFQVDSAGKLVTITVGRRVPRDQLQKFASTLETDPENPSLKAGLDKKIFDQLIAELQHLESDLAFASDGALKKIAWDEPLHRFIPETPKEEELIDVLTLTLSQCHNRQPVRFERSELRNLVGRLHQHEVLQAPKAFWREAINRFHERRYIQAFKDFYLVIEGFYANGKSGNRKVHAEFCKSSELNEIADRCLREVLTLSNHSEEIKKLLRRKGCDLSAEGLLELLVKTRGDLSHYNNRSSKRQGTPFNQNEFWTVALAAMHIATLSLHFHTITIDEEAG